MPEIILKVLLSVYVAYALLKFFDFFFAGYERRMVGIRKAYEGDGRALGVSVAIPPAQPEVSLEAPPGAAIVWEGRTWHRAAACHSEADRVGVVVVTNLSWVRQQDVSAAGLHDEAYFRMTPEERDFVGFKPSGFNCIFPRFPGDRGNAIAGTSEPQTFVPALRRDPY